MSVVARNCTPKPVVKSEVTIDDASEYRRRLARSLKNEFQSNGALAEEVEAGDEEGEVVVADEAEDGAEKYRTEVTAELVG